MIRPLLTRKRSNHQREWGYWLDDPDGRCVAAVPQGPDQGVDSNAIVSAWNNTVALGINPEAVLDLLMVSTEAVKFCPVDVQDRIRDALRKARP